jgi:hypothetical protein
LEDLPGDVPFEAADDLRLGQTLASSSGDAPEGEGAKGCRRILGEETVELVIELVNLGFKVAYSAGNGSKSQFGCLGRVVYSLEVGAKADARSQELTTRTKRSQLLAKDYGRGDNHGS